MKISIVGSNSDTLFILNRISFLDLKDIEVSVFGDQKIQRKLKKNFPFIETPWTLKDTISECKIIFHSVPLKGLEDSFLNLGKILPNDIPIIDFSSNSTISKSVAKKILSHDIYTSVINCISFGKLNFSYQEEKIHIPTVANSESDSNALEKVNECLNNFKIYFKFMDQSELDEMLYTNYYLPNIVLFALRDYLHEKNSVLLKSLNKEYISKLDDLIDSEVRHDLINDVGFKTELRKSVVRLNNYINKTIDHENTFTGSSYNKLDSLLSSKFNEYELPTSKETILSYFFGVKFAKYMTSWGKIKDPDD